MKVLVIGSVPPPTGGHRAALLAEVLRLRRQGHDTEIVALDHLATAHRYLAGPGLIAVGEIALLARRADAVIVQLEAGLPVRRSAGRGERALALTALAAVLRRCPDVTLRMQNRDDMTRGLGGRPATELWKVARRIEVGDEAMRVELAALLGPLGDRVSIATDRSDVALPLTAGLGGWGDGADATAAHVQAIVRVRAAAERASLARRGRLPVDGEPEARVPQWEWLPAPGAGVPDLGPIRMASDGSRRRPAASETASRARRMSARRVATSVLAAAERRSVTRPVAHLARLAWVELRGTVRRAA
jgi:hypothetical protein